MQEHLRERSFQSSRTAGVLLGLRMNPRLGPLEKSVMIEIIEGMRQDGDRLEPRVLNAIQGIPRGAPLSPEMLVRDPELTTHSQWIAAARNYVDVSQQSVAELRVDTERRINGLEVKMGPDTTRKFKLGFKEGFTEGDAKIRREQARFSDLVTCIEACVKHLKANKDSWSLEGGRLVFRDAAIGSQHLRLMAAISASANRAMASDA
jgi:hypothetical protein